MKNLIICTLVGLSLISLISCKEEASTSKNQVETKNSSSVNSDVQPKFISPEESVCKHIVKVIYSSSITEFPSIQSAIDSSKTGATIAVGSGTWSEYIHLKNRDSITVKSTCSAQVFGFEVKKSQNIVIDGFQITNSAEDDNGISIESSSSITINNNRIYGLNDDAKAIRVGPNSQNITITKNYVHHNKGEGLVFSESEKGGPHLLKDNIIFANGKNGIVLAKKQL